MSLVQELQYKLKMLRKELTSPHEINVEVVDHYWNMVQMLQTEIDRNYQVKSEQYAKLTQDIDSVEHKLKKLDDEYVHYRRQIE